MRKPVKDSRVQFTVRLHIVTLNLKSRYKMKILFVYLFFVVFLFKMFLVRILSDFSCFFFFVLLGSQSRLSDSRNCPFSCFLFKLLILSSSFIRLWYFFL